MFHPDWHKRLIIQLGFNVLLLPFSDFFLPLLTSIMAWWTWCILATHILTFRAAAVPVESSPVVSLDYGSYQGFSANATDSFLGIPYARPPVGDLRFRRPKSPKHVHGIQDATAYGNSCMQQSPVSPADALSDIPGLDPGTLELLLGAGATNTSEDCLFVNVIRPTGVKANAKLPVVIWLYGGGFSYGDSSAYDGTPIVERSIATAQPIIYVSLNYRLNAFGFLGGREAAAAGSVNLGLYDQRAAFEWVHKYISRFGGDPSKVIVWGQSAGSMSILAHLTAYGGRDDRLFHGAFMNSGYPQPILSVDQGQSSYDQLVAYTNCSTAKHESSLECLRKVPAQTLMMAVNTTASVLSYSGLNLTWGPKVEGHHGLLRETFRESISNGHYIKVPIVAGECADEGTLFSLLTFNVTTTQGFEEWITTEFGNANSSVVSQVAAAYPSSPTAGSPYNTGINNSITPEFKRISSFSGDFNFQAPRRFMLSTVSKTQNVWAYLFQRGQTSTPVLGSFHGSDLQEFYVYTTDPDWAGADALTNFAYRLNPNYDASAAKSSKAPSVLSNITWPQYKDGSQTLLTFEDPSILTFTPDTYRSSAIDLLNTLETEFGF